MKPEKNSENLLGVTQAMAKMIEYQVPEEKRVIRTSYSPDQLFSLTIGMIGDFAVLINTQNTNPSAIDEQREHLRFSAEFFDSYKNAEIDKEEDVYTLLIGASAYYFSNLPGSANVLINKIPADYTFDFQAGSLDKLLYWLFFSRYTYKEIGKESPYREYIERLEKNICGYFISGMNTKEILSVCDDFRQNVYAIGSSRELLLCDIICAIIRLKIYNSCWKTLPEYSGLDISLWKPVIQKKSFIKELWPAQHLLGKEGVYKGQSAVIQMPTSSGKTKSTELIIRSAFLAQRTSVAVIIAPFRALCSEIKFDLYKAFSGEYDIDINEINDAFDYTEFSFFCDEQKKHIIIITPEKMYYLLSLNSDCSKNIGLIIFDEGHQFDNGSRGITYELLLTELKQMLPADVQRVLISAVIHNSKQIAEWLSPKTEAISGKQILPTQRFVGFVNFEFSAEGQISFVNPENPLEDKFFVPRVIPPFESKNENPLLRESTSNNISLYLALKMAQNDSVAVFCGQKRSVTKLMKTAYTALTSDENLKRPLLYSDFAEIKRIVNLSTANLGNDSIETKCAKMGIFPHHADIPHGLRMAIEYAMHESLIHFIICTSTLAQGVNLPIKYLFIMNPRQAGEIIKVRDFNNLIGRVGRAGKLTEGSIIFTDPEIYQNRNVPGNNYKWNNVLKVLNQELAENCNSTISNILTPILIKDKKGKVIFEQSIEILNLYCSNSATPESITISMLKAYPSLSFDFEDILYQIEYKYDLLERIENFLMLLGNNLSEENAEILAKSTLAYYMAKEENKEKIVSIFKTICARIVGKIPDKILLPIYSKTLRGVEISTLIRQWIDAHKEQLIVSNSTEDFCNLFWDLFLRYIKNKNFKKYTDKGKLKNSVFAWLEGKAFYEIFRIVEGEKINKKERIKIEHVVDIFQNGMSYDGTVLINSITEMVQLLSISDDQKNELTTKLQLFQKQLK